MTQVPSRFVLIVTAETEETEETEGAIAHLLEVRLGESAAYKYLHWTFRLIERDGQHIVLMTNREMPDVWNDVPTEKWGHDIDNSVDYRSFDTEQAARAALNVPREFDDEFEEIWQASAKDNPSAD